MLRAIFAIADYGEPGYGKLGADLVRTPSEQTNLEQAAILSDKERFGQQDRFARVGQRLRAGAYALIAW